MQCVHLGYGRCALLSECRWFRMSRGHITQNHDNHIKLWKSLNHKVISSTSCILWYRKPNGKFWERWFVLILFKDHNANNWPYSSRHLSGSETNSENVSRCYWPWCGLRWEMIDLGSPCVPPSATLFFQERLSENVIHCYPIFKRFPFCIEVINSALFPPKVQQPL